jgi:N-methylhydantoinase A
MHRAADLRYLGQEHTVTVSLGTLGDWATLRTEFDAAHQRAYGYMAPDVEVQLINLRLTVVYPIERPRLARAERRTAGAAPFEARKIYSSRMQDALEFRVFQREHLRAGDSIVGPAAIEEAGTTTIVDAGDTVSVEAHGCLVVEVTS